MVVNLACAEPVGLPVTHPRSLFSFFLSFLAWWMRLSLTDGARIKGVWCGRGKAKWEVLRSGLIGGQKIKS